MADLSHSPSLRAALKGPVLAATCCWGGGGGGGLERIASMPCGLAATTCVCTFMVEVMLALDASEEEDDDDEDEEEDDND